MNFELQNIEEDVTPESVSKKPNEVTSSKYSRRLKDELDQLET